MHVYSGLRRERGEETKAESVGVGVGVGGRQCSRWCGKFGDGEKWPAA